MIRDHKKRAREPVGRALLLALVILAIMLAGACTGISAGPPFDSCEHNRASCYDTTTSHNEAGGYRDACGDLPGLLGDDC